MVTASHLDRSATLERRPVGDHPFSADGTALLARVKGRRVTGWKLEKNAAGPLPESPVQSAEPPAGPPVAPPVGPPPAGAPADPPTPAVSLHLRAPASAAAGQEVDYRILVDELPPPTAPGNIRIAVRLSIPVFAAPRDRVSPQVKWRVVVRGGQAWLTATNAGTRHLSVRNVKLHTADGRDLPVEIKQPPHILPGGARRWLISRRGVLPATGSILRLTADDDIGAVDEQVRVDAGP